MDRLLLGAGAIAPTQAHIFFSHTSRRREGERLIRKGLSVCGGGGRGGGGGGSGKGEGRGDLKNAGEKLKNVHFYLVNA